MPQTLVMNPDADVETVVEMNMNDYGEDGYEILSTEVAEGCKYVTVLWDSEKETLAYVRHRESMTDKDAGILRELIENSSFRIEETEGGHWSIHRDKEFRDHRGH